MEGFAIMTFKQYPKYKDSGVPWLGNVPEGWGVKRLKFAAPLQSGKLAAKGLDLPYIGLENIESWTGKFIPNTEVSETEGVSNTFSAGDVLFGKLRPYLAKALLPDFDGLCSSELLVLRGKEMLPAYLLRFVLLYDFVNQVDASTYGTKMPRANWEFIGNLPAIVPPVDEQSAIAAFLDRETARIDALVEKKTKFIELLKEKRSSLITEAVTGKFDVTTGKPYLKYRDSGVPWLGDVPEGWGAKKLKWEMTLKSGVDEKTPDGEFPLLGANGFIGYSNTATTVGPTVLIGRVGSAGVVNYYEGCYGVSDNVLVVSNWRCDCPRFDFYLLQSLDFTSYVSKNAQPLITASDIRDQKVAIPISHEERAQIVTFLDRETARIDALVEKTGKSIGLLRERRAALITAAVTGKIDVREMI